MRHPKLLYGEKFGGGSAAGTEACSSISTVASPGYALLLQYDPAPHRRSGRSRGHPASATRPCSQQPPHFHARSSLLLARGWRCFPSASQPERGRRGPFCWTRHRACCPRCLPLPPGKALTDSLSYLSYYPPPIPFAPPTRTANSFILHSLSNIVRKCREKRV